MTQWQFASDKILAGGFFRNSIDREELERSLQERAEKGWDFVSQIAVTGQYGATREVLLIFRRSLA